MSPDESKRRFGLRIIMGGVCIWTIVLSIGVGIASRNGWAAVIVLGCGFGFLGVWNLALLMSSRSADEDA